MTSMLHRSLRTPATWAVVVLAAAVVACGAPDPAADPEAAQVSVRLEDIVVARAESLSAGPLISGSLMPDRQATLRAEVPGTVVEVLVEPGQSVRAGQLLARLDDVALAEAAVSARSALRTATEVLAVAKRNADRNTRLAAAGAIADRDREQAEVTAMNAEAGLAEATSRLRAAEKQLQKTRFTAPFSGVVSDRSVRAGDVVQAGNPVLTVVDPSALRLEATVPVSALGAVKVGTSATFGVTGAGDRVFQGVVRRVNPVVDQNTGQVRITILVPNGDGQLVGGLFAQGTAAATTRTTLAVPLAALDLRGASPTVRRIRGGIVESVAVELGLRDENRELIEITKGVAPGDTLLVGGAVGLAIGTRVVVTKE